MINKLFDMTGRCALVTGGSKGIGKAVARGYAEAGANVVISARTEADLKEAVDEISEGLDVHVSYFVADMGDRDQVKALANYATETLGKVDILFNNAGSNKPQPLVETTEDVWDEILELNFTSCMLLSQELAPGMIERGWGRIVYTSSVMAVASNPGRGLYSATKAALIAMSKAQALELGPHGITVNCLAPGPIATDLPMSLLNDEQKKRFAERTAMKRWGEVEDMVGPVLLMSSDAGAYVTGTYILADGGLVCRTFD
ncbi:MAG: SDR family oxidoreductase [Planctomycetota bacterium]|jgi:NAD(P)-dependent dehydrogenase (short-subunit alcohol dehydrogenase family)|nr:SDR family oxidoreductase [Planctomycetota bacterium]MEC8591430.1 SDR family oxidoreductase [Planctomycetota bacterium]MEC8864051.1 SDR family oxidoreductase [Planctomycetota bacterium]